MDLTKYSISLSNCRGNFETKLIGQKDRCSDRSTVGWKAVDGLQLAAYPPSTIEKETQNGGKYT